MTVAGFEVEAAERAIAVLTREWAGLPGVVAPWEATLAEMRAEQDAIVAAGQWTVGPADLLSVIGHGRREVTHCRVLRWLCDPRAPHGLGARFLAGVLAAVRRNVSAETLAGANADVEVARARSRADLVVTAPGLVLVVEAKIDHHERLEQCDDLFADWRGDGGVVFVFLTPDGRTPSTATGEACEAFRTLRFAALRDLLAELVASGAASPAAGAATVTAYLTTLQKEFR